MEASCLFLASRCYGDLGNSQFEGLFEVRAIFENDGGICNLDIHEHLTLLLAQVLVLCVHFSDLGQHIRQLVFFLFVKLFQIVDWLLAVQLFLKVVRVSHRDGPQELIHEVVNDPEGHLLYVDYLHSVDHEAKI